MGMDYRLYALRVFTRDWDRAVAFYSETLGMPIHYANPEIGWAELDTGAAHLAIERLAADDPEADELVGRFVGVSLEVDDIATTHETLAARGVEFLEPPAKQPWGGALAHFRDPDGNVLTLLGASAARQESTDSSSSARSRSRREDRGHRRSRALRAAAIRLGLISSTSRRHEDPK